MFEGREDNARVDVLHPGQRPSDRGGVCHHFLLVLDWAEGSQSIVLSFNYLSKKSMLMLSSCMPK